MDDDVTWKLRARNFDCELRAFCNEAISDGRLDRLRQIASDLFELRQDILDVEHISEQRATKPYPWWLREWKRTTHWLLFAELLDREGKMTRIRNRLCPDRNTDLLQERGEVEGPKRFIDRLACWLTRL
jgi:hypothetical protein